MTKQLTRSAKQEVYGVAAGLAEYFGFSANTVRIILVLLTIFVAKEVALMYLLAAAIMPKADSVPPVSKEQLASA